MGCKPAYNKGQGRRRRKKEVVGSRQRNRQDNKQGE